MKKGFTLLEIMICIAIISVLVLIFFWNKTNNPIEKTKILKIQANLQTVKQEIVKEKIEKNTYPVKEKLLFTKLSVGLQKAIEEFSSSENIPLDDIKESLYKIDEEIIKQSKSQQDYKHFVVFLGEGKRALFYDGEIKNNSFYIIIDEGKDETFHIKKKEFTFAGYQWYAIEGPSIRDKGINTVSNDAKSVWLDERGRLHLKMRYENGKWYGAEIRSKETFGYGTYRFNVDSNFYNYDENVALRLSTYDDSSTSDAFKQVGLTFAKWGKATKEVANFIVEPNTPYTFDPKIGGTYTTHMFTWKQKEVAFNSYYGNYKTDPGPSLWMKDWKQTGDGIPETGAEKVYMNLYLWQGKPPKNNQEVEIVIIDFGFEPLSK